MGERMSGQGLEVCPEDQWRLQLPLEEGSAISHVSSAF